MARLPRTVVSNQPLHIIHRGNNRQDIFETDEDVTRIKEDISASLKIAKCSLHAYVIMTNHLHLLITPYGCRQLNLCAGVSYGMRAFALKAEVTNAVVWSLVRVAVTHWPELTPETVTSTLLPLATAEPMNVLPSPYSVPLNSAM
jgi:hypothetical protein